uniref:hypothetical protein n=1 Tax=Staphylococcus epidermidis TaxID=1282 RepID=UPI0011A500E0
MQCILESVEINEEELEEGYIEFEENEEVRGEGELVNECNELFNYLKEKGKDILDNGYMMRYDMGECLG